jgi:ATP-dependent Zn protease
VAQEDFAEAIEPVVAGLDKKSRVLNDKEKKIRDWGLSAGQGFESLTPNPLSLKLTQSVP